MERWRSFFGSSGEDLWTVIDRALTIAAIDYPQELRVRRDGFAEKLFTPYLHSHTSTFGEGQSLAGPNLRDTKFLATNFHPLTSSIGDAPAFTGSDGRTGSPPLSEREQGREHERTNIARDSHNHEFNPAICSLPNNEELIANMEESRQIHDILTIKEHILNPDQTEATCLAALQTLEDMRISVPILKATVIGKPVNALRKHSSRQVRTAVKRLISLWKDVVDEWVAKEGEDAACAYLDRVADFNNAKALDAKNQVLSVHSELTEETRSLKMFQIPETRCNELSSGPGNSSSTNIANDYGNPHCASIWDNLELQSGVVFHDHKYFSRLSKLANAGLITPVTTEYKEQLVSESGCFKTKVQRIGSSSREALLLHRQYATTQGCLNELPANVKHKSPGILDTKPKGSESSIEVQRLQATKRRLHEFFKQANDAKQQRTLTNSTNGPPVKLRN